jgi:hypothetical protein
MTWKLWHLRPPVQLRVNLGHGLNSWIRCMNLLIERRIQLLKLKAHGDGVHSLSGRFRLR